MSDPEEPATTQKCLICSKPADKRYRPFCSRRCADVDLGRWLQGGYVIPGDDDDGALRDDSAEGETEGHRSDD